MTNSKNANKNITKNNWKTVREESIETQKEILIGPDLVAREAAAKMLNRLKWSPPVDELGVLYWNALGDWRHCAAMGKTALPVLCAIITTTPKDVKAMNYQSQVNAWDVLRKMRITAAKALGELQGTEAFEALKQVVSQPGQIGVIPEAVRSFARYGAAAVDVLVDALNFGGHEEAGQRAIVAVLEEICRDGELTDPKQVMIEAIIQNHAFTHRIPDD